MSGTHNPSMPFHWIWLFACLTILSACSGTKELAEPLPTWIEQRPHVPGYYIGVASANKTQYPSDAAERAQRQALAELAGCLLYTSDAADE